MRRLKKSRIQIVYGYRFIFCTDGLSMCVIPVPQHTLKSGRGEKLCVCAAGRGVALFNHIYLLAVKLLWRG